MNSARIQTNTTLAMSAQRAAALAALRGSRALARAWARSAVGSWAKADRAAARELELQELGLADWARRLGLA